MYSLMFFLFLAISSVMNALQMDCANPKISITDSVKTIDKEYKRFVLACHPDKRRDVDAKKAHAEFVQGQAIFEAVLTDREGDTTEGQFKPGKPYKEPFSAFKEYDRRMKELEEAKKESERAMKELQEEFRNENNRRMQARRDEYDRRVKELLERLRKVKGFENIYQEEEL